MSSRNSRVVRNKTPNKKFDFFDSTKSRIIVSVILVILIIIIAIIIIVSKIKNNKTIEISDGETNLNYEYFILNGKSGLGVVNKKGETIVDSKYNDIYIPNESRDVFICYDENNNSKVLSENGKEIFNNYENVQPINSSNNSYTEKHVLKYEKDGLYGLIDLDGNVVSEAIYTEISSLTDRPGRIIVKKDEKYGLMDSSRKFIYRNNI